MSKSLSAAARRTTHLSRSTFVPDGFRRGKAMKRVELGDDEAGAPVNNPYADFDGEAYEPDYESLVRDLGVHEIDGRIVTRRPLETDIPVVIYAGDATRTALVAYGFTSTDLAELGNDHLAVVAEACKAAETLGLKPKTIGLNRLFTQAGELQAKAEAKIEAERRAEEARKAAEAKRAADPLDLGTESRTAVPASELPKLTATPKASKPEGSDWLGRVRRGSNLVLRCTCGCGVWMTEDMARVPGWNYMQDQLGRRAEIWDLWMFVQAPRCCRGRGYSFKETVATSLDREAELDGNNTLLWVLGQNDGVSHRLSHFVVPLPSGSDAGRVGKLMAKRQKLPSEWNELRGLIGLGRDLAQVQATRIPKWETGERSDVFDLRVFASMWHRQALYEAQRRADHAAYQARQARRSANSSEMSFGGEPDVERSASTKAKKAQQLAKKRAKTPPAHGKR